MSTCVWTHRDWGRDCTTQRYAYMSMKDISWIQFPLTKHQSPELLLHVHTKSYYRAKITFGTLKKIATRISVQGIGFGRGCWDPESSLVFFLTPLNKSSAVDIQIYLYFYALCPVGVRIWHNSPKRRPSLQSTNHGYNPHKVRGFDVYTQYV